MRRWIIRRAAAFSLLAALLLSACSYQGPWHDVDQLHISGVTRVPELSYLDRDDGGFIYGLTTFAPPGEPTSFLISFDSGIYVASEDGQTIHEINARCDIPTGPSVTLDGAWAICPTYDVYTLSARSSDVQLFSPVAGGDVQSRTLTLPDSAIPRQNTHIRQAVWSPDGNYLATIQEAGAECILAFYTFDSVTQAFSPPIPVDTGTALATSVFDATSGCRLSMPAWRADGKWLALTMSLDDREYWKTKIVLLSLVGLSPKLANKLQATFRVPETRFVEIDGRKLTWNPVTGVLAFISGSSDDTIFSYNPETKGLTKLLTIPANVTGSIEALTWTPDGSALYFAYGVGCVDCGIDPRSDVYKFTPPGAAPATIPAPTSTPPRPTPIPIAIV